MVTESQSVIHQYDFKIFVVGNVRTKNVSPKRTFPSLQYLRCIEKFVNFQGALESGSEVTYNTSDISVWLSRNQYGTHV